MHSGSAFKKLVKSWVLLLFAHASTVPCFPTRFIFAFKLWGEAEGGNNEEMDGSLPTLAKVENGQLSDHTEEAPLGSCDDG